MNSQVFTVFTGPSARGNLAEVMLVDSLPDTQGHLHYIQLNSDYPGSTVVYIKPLTEKRFAIRWFNNNNAIKRCGHGTLAAAAFVHNHLHYKHLHYEHPHCNRSQNHSQNPKKLDTYYHFISDSETLDVHVSKKNYTLTFPPTQLHHLIIDANNIHADVTNNNAVSSTLAKKNSVNKDSFSFVDFNKLRRHSQTEEKAGYIILELEDVNAVQDFILHDKIIALIEKRALIITARSYSTNIDIVFRYFAPQHGQREDTATGSAGSVLWPFWKGQFDANTLTLRCSQLSAKGGYLLLGQTINGNVLVSGSVTVFPNNEY